MHAPKHILTFLSIFLFSNLAFSQVVIKDTVVITPKGNVKSLSISNPQYYTATITISCDALNNTHDPILYRGSVDAQIGTSTIHIADALPPGGFGRTGVFIYTSSPNTPLTLDMPIQVFIGGIQDSLTQDNPLFFEIIADSTLVGSVVYQQTYPFPTVRVTYPLDGQEIFGAKTIHAEAQVDPSPDNSATVTWSVSTNWPYDEWTSTPADIDLTGLDYDDIYIKATATNKYGSAESGPVLVGIYAMDFLPGNKFFPQYSGTLTVQATPDLVDSSFYNPSNAMQLTMNGVPVLSSSVLEASVHVSQWGALDFQLLKNGYPRGPGLNTGILETNGEAVFDETDYSYSPGYTFEFFLTTDSTQEALPPDWLYTDPDDQQVDPFVPSPTIFIAPVSGELMLQITDTSTAAIDTLFLQSPVKKFLLANQAAYLGDTVDCGAVTAGDTIQFYLHSNEKIVADSNMYPEIFLGGGGTPTIAARGGPTSGVSSLNLGSRLLKSLAEKKSPQGKLMAEKIKKIISRRSLSSSRVAGHQPKNVKVQAAHHVKASSVKSTADDASPLATLVFEDETDLDYNDFTADTWIKPSYSILLGETKYYTAILDPDDNSKLIIRESSDPDLGNGNSGIIFEDPVASAGDDKVGVYFDYNKPDGTGLDNGVIRILGRYLKSDASQNYIVTLHAVLKSENRDEYINIKVSRPSSLGSTHSTANDVDGQTYNLDKLIIDNAGQAGVFPQYIKAIIQVESMSRFDPCYRYEPFKDMAVLQQKDKRTQKYIYESNMYRILSATDKGTPPIPTDPKNLRDPSANPMPEYPGYIMVWDFYQAGLNKTWYTAKHYKFLEDEWKKVRAGLPKELFGKEETQLSSNENKIASDSTDSRIFRWLQYEYQGGMAGKIAQTRLAASYGIMQVVYSGSSVYPQNDQQFLPEGLSVASTSIEYGVKTLVSKFHLKSVVGKNFDNATWSSGLETSYGNALFQYNRSRDYPPQVVSLLPNYMPNP